MLILFCVPIIHICLINIFISDAQGKYSTFNAMSEWAEPVNKENGLAYIICGGVVMYV